MISVQGKFVSFTGQTCYRIGPTHVGSNDEMLENIKLVDQPSTYIKTPIVLLPP